MEISLCKFCGCMTNTIRKPGMSASENKHYRYECGKCGAKKELEIIKRLKIKLTKKDFLFVEQYMTNHNIPEGKGFRYILEDFLNEYKRIK